MTIVSVQTIVPDRYSITPAEKAVSKPPPKVYPVQEAPFKGYQPPQPDGYERSKANPGASAIVIDNGKFEASCACIALLGF